MKVIRDGVEREWDPKALEWKVRGLEDQPKPKIEILEWKPQKGRFVCPDCGAGVEIFVFFSGWEAETIDPVTGDPVSLIDGGRDEVHDEEYRCALACGWVGGYSWWESIQNGEEEEDDKKKEEDAAFAALQRFIGEHATPDQI